ncbi:MAG: hypothetical protein F9K42_03985, partial [Ignavibacterium sp.]
MKKLSYSLMLIISFLLSTQVNLKAQEKWYYYSSLQVYGSSQQNDSYLLYNGIRYQTQNLYLSLNIPLLFNHNNSFNSNEQSSSGNMMNQGNMGLFNN